MELNLIAEFMHTTGASTVEAYNYLLGNEWNLKGAIHQYLSVNEGSDDGGVPPDYDWTYAADSCKKPSPRISSATDDAGTVVYNKPGSDFRQNGIYRVEKYFVETPVFTFTLPDLSIFPEDFRRFLIKDLIELSSLRSLEQAGRLNWWTNGSGAFQRLWPLSTSGDGNCLLHAASLGMWGFHDRLLTLRGALYKFLSSSEYRYSIWRRWRWQLTRLNAEAGFAYTEEEWEREWNSIVGMASIKPTNRSSTRCSTLDKLLCRVSDGTVYQGLEDIHVLALSHVLKRPIIVIADTVLRDVHGEAFAPIHFGGVYLPLEISPSQCHNTPLLLTYYSGHFSALVAMDRETFADCRYSCTPAVIPLTDARHRLLPVKFCVDPGPDFVWGVDERLQHVVERLTLDTKDHFFFLKEYLDVVLVPVSHPSPTSDGEEDFYAESEMLGDEENIERRFFDVADSDVDDITCGTMESGLFGVNKNRAAKQLQSVAKQFGSIGKSMSNRLRKNFGNVAKNTTKTDSRNRGTISGAKSPRDDLMKSEGFILAARLHTEERHEYQQEMIKNYLHAARNRFEREMHVKQKAIEENSNFNRERLRQKTGFEGCKNSIAEPFHLCEPVDTSDTSHWRTFCYEKPRREESKASLNSPCLSRAGAGSPQKLPVPSQNSSDHVEVPRSSKGRSNFCLGILPKRYERTKNFCEAAGNTVNPSSETLYLSKSTFYDGKSPEVGFCSKDWSDSPAGVSKAHHKCSAQVKHDYLNMCQGDDGSDQGDGGTSIVLPAGFSSPKNQTSRHNDEGFGRIRSCNLAGESFQPTTNTEGSRQPSPKPRNYSPRTGNSTTVSDVTSIQSRLENDSGIPESRIENLNRKEFYSHSKSMVNENFVTATTPVRSPSHNSSDHLLGETAAEDLNENDQRGNVYPGGVRIVPVAMETETSKTEPENGRGSAGGKKLDGDFVDRKVCLNITCEFFGSPDLENYCSQCYRGRFENLASFENSPWK